jgi:hypothetical protein
VSGTAAGNAVYQYRFAKTAIEVTAPMRLTAYRAASGIGSGVQLMLTLRSGQTITTAVDSIDGSFERLVAYIPQSFAGDVIDGLSVYLSTPEAGAFSAIIDDLLIEEYAQQDTGIDPLPLQETAGAYKFLRNGILFIVRDGNIMNVLGQPVKYPPNKNSGPARPLSGVPNGR